ncbi:MAG: hypothetical protein QM773_11600 [Hyphomonadaceae bacterium]
MDDREAERDHIDRVIRHVEAKLMKAAHGPASSRDLAALAALHERRRRLTAPGSGGS